MQFLHRVQVLEVEFESRAIGRLGHPEVEVFALARFEKEYVVAVVEVGELVELVEFGFGVEFGVFAGVGEEGVDVVEEVAVSVVYMSDWGLNALCQLGAEQAI